MITREEYNILLGEFPEYINQDGLRDLDYRILIHFFENDDVFKSKIKELIKLKRIEDQHESLYTLAQIIFFENQEALKGKKLNFIPTKYQVKFLSFMYSTDTFSSRNIPREKWIDLLEEDLDLLAKMIVEDSLLNFEEDERFIALKKKQDKRHDELAEQYPDLNEFR